MQDYINVTSYQDIKANGFYVPEKEKEQMDIIFAENSNLKFQTRINPNTKGIYVGMTNKLIAFVERINTIPTKADSAEVNEDEEIPQFSFQELDEMNSKHASKWMDDGDMVGVISETHGGIIA